MKRHILSILLLSFLLISPQSYSKKIKWKKETVAVSGNCNMCKNKIEFTFNSYPYKAINGSDVFPVNHTIYELECNAFLVK